MALGVRPATADDLHDVWVWRNDPATRAASFDTQPVPLERHRAWFMAAIDDPQRRLLVVEEGLEAIGLVRFDGVGDGCWTVGINLAPDQRGRGRAAPALRAAIDWLASNCGVREVVARIKTTNVASQRAFRSAGFVAMDEDEGVETLSWTGTAEPDVEIP